MKIVNKNDNLFLEWAIPGPAFCWSDWCICTRKQAWGRGAAVALCFLCPIARLLPHSMLAGAQHGEGASSRGPSTCLPTFTRLLQKETTIPTLLQLLYATQEPADAWPALPNMKHGRAGNLQSGISVPHTHTHPAAPFLGEPSRHGEREQRGQLVPWWCVKSGEGCGQYFLFPVV